MSIVKDYSHQKYKRCDFCNHLKKLEPRYWLRIDGDFCEECNLFFCDVCRDDWNKKTNSNWMFQTHVANGFCKICAKIYFK